MIDLNQKIHIFLLKIRNWLKLKKSQIFSFISSFCFKYVNIKINKITRRKITTIIITKNNLFYFLFIKFKNILIVLLIYSFIIKINSFIKIIKI